MSISKPERFARTLEHFLSTPLDGLLGTRSEPPQAHALRLFHEVSREVPAYTRFLEQHQIRPDAIRTAEDFAKLPLCTKPDYIRKYALADLCRAGDLATCDFMAVSSGSTGEPTFWPRASSDELAIATRFEQVFRDSFRAHEKPTLAVVCFALGTWVGGMFTTSCCRYLAAKGYPVVVVSPGNNAGEIHRVVKALSPLFKQTVLLGYPPFLKDVIDRGQATGIDWAALNIKLVMAGEVFSEEWRDMVAKRIGSHDPLHDFSSLYGTADAGVLACETPLSIAIRRFLSAKPEAARALFGESRLPTLAQYDPFSRYFEVKDRTLLFTGDNGIPLIRYHIADTGGIVSFSDMQAFLKEQGFDMKRAVLEAREMPFVYVFGRADFTVSFFGANVYPENIAVGLEQPAIHEHISGKFVLEAIEGISDKPVLSITVELKEGVSETDALKQAMAESVKAHLKRLNSEFANYVPPEFQTPRITLKALGDPAYFPLGVKHRYTRKPKSA